MLTLGGLSTYTGSTMVTGGTLVASSSGALGNTSVTIVGDPTGNSQVSLLTQGGVTLATDVVVTNSGGRTRLGGVSGNSAFTGDIMLRDSVQLFANTGVQVTFSGIITGTVACAKVVKTGAGTLTLSGAADYVGDTIVSNGVLALNRVGGVSVGSNLVVTAGKVLWQQPDQVRSNAIVQITGGTVDLNGNDQTVKTLVMSGGTFTTGSGTLSLGGTVTASATNLTPVISGYVDLAGDTIFDITHGGYYGGVDLRVNAAITNSATGDLIKTGNGVLLLQGNSSYAGQTRIEAGEVQVGSNNGLGNSVAVVGVNGSVTNATLRLINGVTLNNDIIVNSGAGSRTIASTGILTNTLLGTMILSNNVNAILTANNGNLLKVDGQVSGSGGLTINGAGVVELAGANTFTGDTMVINAATLIANNTSGFANGNGTLTLANLGVLAGTGSVSTLQLSGGGIFSPGEMVGTNSSVGTMTVNNWTWDTNGRLQWSLDDALADPSYGWDFVSILATLTFTNSGAGSSYLVYLDGFYPTNFNLTTPRSFRVASAGSIVGFNSNMFAFVANSFFPRTNGWGFVASVQGSNLYFNYVQGGQMLVIPEPNVLLLWVSSLATIYAARRRLNGKNKKSAKTVS